MNPLESLFDELKIQKLINVSRVLPDSTKKVLSYAEADAKATFLILMNSELAEMYFKSHQKHRLGLDLRSQSNQLASSVILISLCMVIWIITLYLFNRKKFEKWSESNENKCCPGHYLCCEHHNRLSKHKVINQSDLRNTITNLRRKTSYQRSSISANNPFANLNNKNDGDGPIMNSNSSSDSELFIKTARSEHEKSYKIIARALSMDKKRFRENRQKRSSSLINYDDSPNNFATNNSNNRSSQQERTSSQASSREFYYHERTRSIRQRSINRFGETIPEKTSRKTISEDLKDLLMDADDRLGTDDSNDYQKLFSTFSQRIEDQQNNIDFNQTRRIQRRKTKRYERLQSNCVAQLDEKKNDVCLERNESSVVTCRTTGS